MYLITEKEFISARPGHVDYNTTKTRFLSGDYNFVVFSDDSPEHGLLTKADPQRTRIIYRQDQQICANDISCVARRPTESYIDFLSKNPDPHIYMSSLGHCNRSQGTLSFALKDVSVIAEKVAMLEPFIPLRRVLFYGAVHSSRKNVITGMGVRMGIEVVNVKVDASKKSLFDWMVENKCFAALGMDGAVVPCWRDWEIALAGIPALRHTCRSENLPFVDPCGCYSTFIDIDDGEQAIQQLSEGMRNGSAAKRLLLSSTLAITMAKDCEFTEAMDALVCDHGFLTRNIREGRASLEAFVHKGKEALKNYSLSILKPLVCQRLTARIIASPKGRTLTLEERLFIGQWQAKHRQWSGLIDLLEDGSFKGGGSRPDGTWEVKYGKLIFWWTHWPPEIISISKGKLGSPGFELDRIIVAPKKLPITGTVKNTFLVASFYMSNMNTEAIGLQKAVFDKYCIPIQQILFSDKTEDGRTLDGGNAHAAAIDKWLQKNIDKAEVIVVFDVDAIPLTPFAVPTIVNEAAKSDRIVGIAQQSNHIHSDHPYAGPACFSISAKLYSQMGQPSFSKNRRSDVAEEITFMAEKMGISLTLLWPTHVEAVRWPLGKAYAFGLGTTYDNMIYHAYEGRFNTERFINKCREVLAQ